MSIATAMIYKTLLKNTAKNSLVLLTALMVLLLQNPISANEPAKILVLGDSLSAGYGMDISESWTTLLQNKLSELGYGYSVANASISGDTTSSGLQRLPRALKVHQPEIVIINLGGNDGLRATSIATLRANLLRMIQLSQEAGARVILAGIQIPPNYGKDYTDRFTSTFFDVAAETNAAIIPFFMKNVALNPTMMQRDNIHPTAGAQPLLLQNTWVVLEPLLNADSN
ncbi:MAG: arylesterase [Gammaproteobacteria bacterium]|nr:arylesterase [Gammaproteobacteria bacterium]